MIARLIKKKEYLLILGTVFLMLIYFILATPAMNDDGFHYEGFAESLAGGKLDFKSFYGFQGLSFFAVPIFWLTHSKISIIIASVIFSLLSLPLAYLIGRDFYESKKSGIYFLILFFNKLASATKNHPATFEKNFSKTSEPIICFFVFSTTPLSFLIIPSILFSFSFNSWEPLS